jgi:hypothetical protein
MNWKLLILLLLSNFYFLQNNWSQAPQAFKYQTVVRSMDGSLMADTNVYFQFSILEEGINGDSVYVENHFLTTSSLGLVQARIGAGSVVTGTIESINWGSSEYFLKTEVKFSTTEEYQLMGISQLLSVPYALFAENVANADDDWEISGEDILSSNNGNVAVGLTNPEEKLHVSGNIKTEDTLKFKGYTNPDISNPGQILIGERDIKIGYKEDNFGNILIGNSLYGKTVFDLNLTGSGNIGIGTDVFNETTTGFSNVCIGMYSGYNLSNGNNNVLLGTSAGEHMETGAFNICLGNQTGNGRNGNRNIFMGDRAGYAWNGTGNDNIMLGYYTGFKFNSTNSNSIFIGAYAGYDVSSSYNVFIGPYGTGRSSVGEDNIFIGRDVGRYFVGDDFLLIDNRYDEDTPFIKGDMENDILEINADLKVKGTSEHESIAVEKRLNLKELSEFPVSPQEGDLIYINDTLRFYNGILWKNLW